MKGMVSMIELTKLNNEIFYLHPDQIQMIEITPDTIITMTNGKKYIALEDAGAITDKMVEFYRRIHTVKIEKSKAKKISEDK